MLLPNRIKRAYYCNFNRHSSSFSTTKQQPLPVKAAATSLLLLLLLATQSTPGLAYNGATNTTAAAADTAAPTRVAADPIPANSSKAETFTQAVLYGTGSWGTLMSFFFLLSAVFVDLLLIRSCLVLAFIFFIITIALNFPDVTNWTNNPRPHTLILGTLCWNVIGLALQVRVQQQAAILLSGVLLAGLMSHGCYHSSC